MPSLPPQECLRRVKSRWECGPPGLGLHFFHQHLPYGLLGFQGAFSRLGEIAGDFLPASEIEEGFLSAGFIAFVGGQIAEEEEEDDEEAGPASSEDVREGEAGGMAADVAEPALVAYRDPFQFVGVECPEKAGVGAVSMKDTPSADVTSPRSLGFKAKDAIFQDVAARRKNVAFFPDRRSYKPQFIPKELPVIGRKTFSRKKSSRGNS